MTDPSWLRDPDSAWQIKLARAEEHIDDLAGQIGVFVRSGTYQVEAEQGADPLETVYRLRMSQPIPRRFSAVVGDALNNMRSALDCAIYGLACRNMGRELTPAEEAACQFPIYGVSAELDAFFRRRYIPELLGPNEDAIRAVQPGALHDYLAAQGGTGLHPREEEVAYDSLTLLSRLTKIDKHRRLHVITWWPDLIYWGSDLPTNRRWRWGQPPFEDGAILGILIDDPQNPEPSPGVRHELQLRVWLPPTSSASSAQLLAAAVVNSEVVRLLTGLHQHLARRVLPRLFQQAPTHLSPPLPG